ncbi:MAG: sugar transferase [Planctomycetota bacterium]
MQKRLLDIVFSLSVLTILSLPLLLVAIVLRLTGERKVFFYQKRIGYRRAVFEVTKFVTMVTDAEVLGSRDITLADDPRVLPFGRFLRKTKLNEMPQFWDILVGKMTLVGWRPLLPDSFNDYSLEIQERLIESKPGLTGIGSLVFRDEEELLGMAAEKGRDMRVFYREEILPYKGAIEVWYIENSCLHLDCKILIATVIAVLAPNSPGYLTWFKDLPRPTSELIRKHLGTQEETPN